MKLSPSYQASVPRMVMVPLGWSKKVLTRLLRSSVLAPVVTVASSVSLSQAQAHCSTYLTTHWRSAWRLLRIWRLKKLFKSEACFILRQGFTVWCGPHWPGIPAFPIPPDWLSFSLAIPRPQNLWWPCFLAVLLSPCSPQLFQDRGRIPRQAQAWTQRKKFRNQLKSL